MKIDPKRLVMLKAPYSKSRKSPIGLVFGINLDTESSSDYLSVWWLDTGTSTVEFDWRVRPLRPLELLALQSDERYDRLYQTPEGKVGVRPSKLVRDSLESCGGVDKCVGVSFVRGLGADRQARLLDRCPPSRLPESKSS
jgi:hypothetical protein